MSLKATKMANLQTEDLVAVHSAWVSLRRQAARPVGKRAAQPNECVKVQVRLFVLTSALTINTHWRWVQV